MTALTQTEALVLLLVFGAGMYAAVRWGARQEASAEGFLVAHRNVSVWRGAMSIAVSWIWAPAIFICSMQAYNLGLPGIFWFTAPNILCFFVFIPLAKRLRREMPQGYSLPHYIAQKRFPGERRTHLAYLVIFFGYQLGAIIINSLAGGQLLHAISGIDVRIAILLFAAIPLFYTWNAGLKASIFTDVIQMTMVLVIAFVLVPWCVAKAGGLSAITQGLAGIDGRHGNLLDPWVAFSMGIPMTLSLIAGPIGDQMFFQRAMATRPESIGRTFAYGGLLFGVVPILLSLLGFVAVTLTQQGALTVNNPQLVGVEVIVHLLPHVSVYAFAFILCATLDSSFCAISSLGTVDIYKRYFNPDADDAQILRVSRWSMLLLAAVGIGIALLQPKLLWVFLTYGALASAGLFPTVLAVFWKRLPARGAFWAIVLSLVVAAPLSIYANVQENPYLIVAASVASVGIGLVVCLVSGWLSPASRD